jgi:hypothetical protein
MAIITHNSKKMKAKSQEWADNMRTGVIRKDET